MKGEKGGMTGVLTKKQLLLWDFFPIARVQPITKSLLMDLPQNSHGLLLYT